MTGRIIVGIDGSEQSGRALEWAVARARLGGEQLELINAYSVVPDFDFYGFHGAPAGHHVAWLTEFSEQVLEAAEGRVRELAPEVTCQRTSAMGQAAYVLSEASTGADMVVVGRRGLGGAASALLGSVSNRLAVQTKCPLVVVGEEEVPTAGPVVVGVDGSDFATHALRFAIAEAALRRTSVRAVAAYDALHPAFDADPELLVRLRAEVDAELADTIGRALDEVQGSDDSSVSVEPVLVEGGRAAEAILRNARDAQLVVVGTHGKGLVRRILLGSVSREVLTDAARPVALVDLPAS